MHEGAAIGAAGDCAAFRAASEDVMVARDMLLAELTGARYHVAHISTRNAVGDGGVRASRAGLPVTCEDHAAPFRAGRRATWRPTTAITR